LAIIGRVPSSTWAWAWEAIDEVSGEALASDRILARRQAHAGPRR
jgi:hypothetical protein